MIRFVHFEVLVDERLVSYLPALVMIISVPTSWNFAHNSRSCKYTFIPSIPFQTQMQRVNTCI